MMASIAWIESRGRIDATRYEAHLNESSMGLTQVLPSTAQWLANDMGHDRFGRNPDLLDPACAM